MYRVDKLPMKLKEMRKSKGINQKELSQRCNVAINSVYLWESGKFLPSIYSLCELADALECSLADLLKE